LLKKSCYTDFFIVKGIMQTKKDRVQSRMMLLPPLEEFIPEDHHIRRLNGVLDLSFVHEAVRECYCQDNGRPSIDPEVIIRLFLLQAVEGIEHIRDLLRQVAVNLAYRWFIGYDLDEKLPDHSTLSCALDRFGDEVFDRLFERSIAQCQASGLIEGRVLHLDATTIRADIDRDWVGKPDSSDPDARYGHFPNGKVLPGYKQQTVVDGKSRVIVGLEVVPADRHESQDAVDVIDQAVEHLGSSPEAVCADRAYASGANSAALEERGVRLVSPPPKVVTCRGSAFFSIEDFEYDESKDSFICPAGATLTNKGAVKDEPWQYRYRCGPSICGKCKLRAKCTTGRYRQLHVSKNHGALIRLRADSKTESFHRLYRARAPVVEGVFAESKCWHGLRRAWRRGLAKMRVQSLLVAAAINFKRLIALFNPLDIIFWPITCLFFPFWKKLADFQPIQYSNTNLRLKCAQ
jgi:transposase